MFTQVQEKYSSEGTLFQDGTKDRTVKPSRMENFYFVGFLRVVYALLVLSICAFCAINAFSDAAKRNCSKDQTTTENKCGKSPKVEPRKESVVVTGTFAPIPINEIDRSVSVIETRENP